MNILTEATTVIYYQLTLIINQQQNYIVIVYVIISPYNVYYLAPIYSIKYTFRLILKVTFDQSKHTTRHTD